MVLSLEQARKIRRGAIKLAQRLQQPGTGSSIAFLTRRTADVEWFDLSKVLTGINWAVVGAVATRHYMPERVTKDLDIIIVAADAPKLAKQLREAGFTYQGTLSIGGSQWTAPNGQDIDVLEGREKWWKETLEAAQNNRDLQGLPILPLPQLILLKLKAGRLQDVTDISRMLGQADESQLAKVKDFIARYDAIEYVEDLDSIITLGKLEMDTP